MNVCNGFSLKSSFSFNNVHLLLKFLFVVESHFVFGNSSFSETSEVLHLILTFGFLIDMFGAKRTDCFRHKIEFLQKSLYALAWDCAIGKPVSHSVLVYRNLPGNSLTLNRSPNTQMLQVATTELFLNRLSHNPPVGMIMVTLIKETQNNSH